MNTQKLINEPLGCNGDKSCQECQARLSMQAFGEVSDKVNTFYIWTSIVASVLSIALMVKTWPKSR